MAGLVTKPAVRPGLFRFSLVRLHVRSSPLNGPAESPVLVFSGQTSGPVRFFKLWAAGTSDDERSKKRRRQPKTSRSTRCAWRSTYTATSSGCYQGARRGSGERTAMSVTRVHCNLRDCALHVRTGVLSDALAVHTTTIGSGAGERAGAAGSCRACVRVHSV